ncbi:hypothetical protein ACO0QE_004073 [Hanseniaspora vineae]
MKKTVTFNSTPTDIAAAAQRSPTKVNSPENFTTTQNQPQLTGNQNKAANDNKAAIELSSHLFVPNNTAQPEGKFSELTNLKPILKPFDSQNNRNQVQMEPADDMSRFTRIVENLAQLGASKPKEGQLLALLNDIFKVGLIILKKHPLDPTDLDTFLSTKEIFHVYSNFNYTFQLVKQSFPNASVSEVVTDEIGSFLQLASKHLANLGTLMRDTAFFESKFLARIYVQIVKFYAVFLNKTDLMAKNLSNQAFRTVLQKIMKELLLNLKIFVASDAPVVTRRSILLSIIGFYKDLNASSDIWNEFDFKESLSLLLNSMQMKDETVRIEKLDLIVAFVIRYPELMLESINLWFLQHVIINFLADTIKPFDEKVYLSIGLILMACVHKYCLYPEKKQLFQALIFYTEPSELHALNNNDSLTLTFSEFEGNKKTATIWRLLTSKLNFLQSMIKEKLVMDVWSALSLLCYNKPQTVFTKVNKKALLNIPSTGPVLSSPWIAVNTNAFLNFDYLSQKQALVSRRDLAFILFEVLSEEKNPAKMGTYLTYLFELSFPEKLVKAKNVKLAHYFLQYIFKIAHLLSFYTYHGHLLCLPKLLEGLFKMFGSLIEVFPTERNKILMHETTLFQRMLQQPACPDVSSSTKKALSNFVIKLLDIDPLNSLNEDANKCLLHNMIRLIKTYPEVDYTNSVNLLLRRFQQTYASTFTLCDVFVALLSQCKNYEHLKTSVDFLIDATLSHFQQSVVSPESNETLFTRLLKQTGLLETDFFEILQNKLSKTNLSPDTILRVYASLMHISKTSDNLIKKNYPECLADAKTNQPVLSSIIPALIPLINFLPTDEAIEFVGRNVQGFDYDFFKDINFDRWSAQMVVAFLSDYKNLNGNKLPLTSDKVLLSFFEQHQNLMPLVLHSIKELFTDYSSQFERLAVKSATVFEELQRQKFTFSSRLIAVKLKDLSSLKPDTAIDFLTSSLNPLIFTQYKEQFSEWLYYVRIDNNQQWLNLHKLLGATLPTVYGINDEVLINEYIRLYIHTGHWSETYNFLDQSDINLHALSIEVLAGLACFSKDAGSYIINCFLEGTFPVISAIIAEWISLRNVYGVLMFMDQIINCYVQGERKWSRDEKFVMATNFNRICYLLSTYGESSEYQLFSETLVSKITAESLFMAELFYIAVMQPNFYRPQNAQKHAAILDYAKKNKSSFICPSIKLGFDWEVGLKPFEIYYEDTLKKSENFIPVSQFLGAQKNLLITQSNANVREAITSNPGTNPREDEENRNTNQSEIVSDFSKSSEPLREANAAFSSEPEFIDSSTQISSNTQLASTKHTLPTASEKTIRHSKNSAVASQPGIVPESFETISEYTNSSNEAHPQNGFHSQSLQHLGNEKQKKCLDENSQVKSSRLEPVSEHQQMIISSNISTDTLIFADLKNKNTPKQLTSNAVTEKSGNNDNQVRLLTVPKQNDSDGTENEIESDIEKDVEKITGANTEPESTKKTQEDGKPEAKVENTVHIESQAVTQAGKTVEHSSNKAVEANTTSGLETSKKQFHDASESHKEFSVAKEDPAPPDTIDAERDAKSASKQQKSSSLQNGALVQENLNPTSQKEFPDANNVDSHNDSNTSDKQQNHLCDKTTNVALNSASESAAEEHSPERKAKYKSAEQNERKHKLTAEETVKAKKKTKVSILQTSKVRKIVAAMRRFTEQEVGDLTSLEKSAFKEEVTRFLEKL